MRGGSIDQHAAIFRTEADMGGGVPPQLQEGMAGGAGFQLAQTDHRSIASRLEVSGRAGKIGPRAGDAVQRQDAGADLSAPPRSIAACSDRY